MPTFCDLHLHAPRFLYQGTGLHLPLMQWLNEYTFKAEEGLDADPTLAERVYARLTERLIENGTGAVLHTHAMQPHPRKSDAASRDQGICGQALHGHVLAPNIRRTIRFRSALVGDFVRRVMSWHGRASACTPTPGGTCPHASLRTHVLGCFVAKPGRTRLCEEPSCPESYGRGPRQVDYVRRERGKSDVDIFAQFRLLTPRTVQAHCTFLDPLSLVDVAKSGAAIAHCPLSNAYFSAKPFRLREALNLGVKVRLGTDIAGGYDIDIMGCMRQAVSLADARRRQDHSRC